MEIFLSAIDKQLRELDSRSNEQPISLLKLSSIFIPKKGYKAVNINDIYSLVENFYPIDFTK